MASFIDDIRRNMLPLWRNYGDALLTRELEFTGHRALPVKFEMYDNYVKAWRIKKTIINAADLVNAAVASGNKNHPDVIDAAEFMLNRSEECSPLAIDVAHSIVGNNNAPIVNSSSIMDSSFETIAKDLIDNLQHQEDETKAKIGLLRKRIHEHCYNPIVYCELARCYANLGMEENAKKYMNYAVYLAPHSRYISRCAARFFVHCGDLDKAKRVLINNGYVNNDPWIMSAEIAVESVMGKASRYIKTGRQLVLSKNITAFSSSELCFAICNEDRNAGKRKDARKMYEMGIIEPNDNSLAQVEFFAKDDININLDLSSFSNIIHKHEADTRRSLSQGNYEDAFISALKWMQDYRFEHRPIEFAFTLSCNYLKKYDYAIEIVQRFLMTNPKDPSAVNNLAYVLGLSNRLEEAEKILTHVNLEQYNKENSSTGICLVATYGLIEYRKGNIEIGRELYNKAIAAANKRKDKNLAAKARLNMIREEVHNIDDYDKSVLNELDSLSTGSKMETEQLKKDIMEEITKKSDKQ